MEVIEKDIRTYSVDKNIVKDMEGWWARIQIANNLHLCGKEVQIKKAVQ